MYSGGGPSSIERIAQLKHGLTDMRALFDNDLRFLEQFG